MQYIVYIPFIGIHNFYNLVNLHTLYYTIAGWAKKLDLVLWVFITQNKYANVVCSYSRSEKQMVFFFFFFFTK
jgi:hypothetical protein